MSRVIPDRAGNDGSQRRRRSHGVPSGDAASARGDGSSRTRSTRADGAVAKTRRAAAPRQRSAGRRADAVPASSRGRSAPSQRRVENELEDGGERIEDWQVGPDEAWNIGRRRARNATSNANAGPPTSGRSRSRRATNGRTTAGRSTSDRSGADRGGSGSIGDAHESAPARSRARRAPARPNSKQRRSAKAAAPTRTHRNAGTERSNKTPKPAARGRRSAKREASTRFSVGHSKPRLWTLILLISGVLTIILVQVIQLQTTDGSAYRAEGESQWSRTRTLAPKRGTIFDRNGQELAVSIPSASISINPKLIDDPDSMIRLLTEVVGLSADNQNKLLAAMAAKERSFVYVERQAPLEVGERIQKIASTRKLRGINVDYEDKRVLPGGTTAKSVIGGTDIDGVGISGLELEYGGGEAAVKKGYSNILSGIPGSSTREVAEDGSTVAGTERITTEPVAGEDLVLTIDRSIQFAVEKALVARVNELGNKGGQILVLDTKSGELLASATVERDTDTGVASVVARNSAAVDAYEPGSVVKAITVSAALNEGTVTPDTTFIIPWREKYADDWLADAEQHPTQEMTVSEILINSSNIGTIKIKEGMASSPEVARRTHWNYMRKFGLGEKTGIGFPAESPGILKDWDDLWGSERATVSYGQGVSSTSLQLITAINTIANDGIYVAPKIVKGIIDGNGKLTATQASATHEVIRPDVAEQMHAMMRSVVCSGTAQLAQEGVESFTVAGKTGTGYKAQPNGTYFNELGERSYYASFVGFFPADDPQITMLVSIDEPPADSHDRFGGTAAAPVFAQLVPTVAHARHVSPSPGGGACPQ